MVGQKNYMLLTVRNFGLILDQPEQDAPSGPRSYTMSRSMMCIHCARVLPRRGLFRYWTWSAPVNRHLSSAPYYCDGLKEAEQYFRQPSTSILQPWKLLPSSHPSMSPNGLDEASFISSSSGHDRRFGNLADGCGYPRPVAVRETAQASGHHSPSRRTRRAPCVVHHVEHTQSTRIFWA